MSAPRLLSWLVSLALLLAPLAMIGGAPAMAHGAVAASHCTEVDKPAEAPPPAPIDCMIACAGLVSQTTDVPVRCRRPAAPERLAGASGLPGLAPEAATPPPRFG